MAQVFASRGWVKKLILTVRWRTMKAKEKTKAREDARQKKTKAKEDARQKKTRAKEDARQKKTRAREDALGTAKETRAKEDARQKKTRAKGDALGTAKETKGKEDARQKKRTSSWRRLQRLPLRRRHRRRIAGLAGKTRGCCTSIRQCRTS